MTARLPAQGEQTQSKQYGEAVRVPKAATLVASSLRQQIIGGVVGDGEPLPSEAELMTQFGVSRPTLREAIRILESENLVSIRRGARGGPTAHQIQADLVSRYAGLMLQSLGTTLSDVYDARIILEPACVRDLSRSRTEQDLEMLREALTLEEESSDITGSRVGFHHMLIERTGNQTLILFSRLISDLLISAAEGVVVGLDPDEAHREHLRLLELIENRDASGAFDHWRSHLKRAKEYVLDQAGGDLRVVDVSALRG